MSGRNPGCTKELAEARVSDIVQILLNGAQAWDMIGYVRKNEQDPKTPWFIQPGNTPLSYDQIRRYTRRAEAEITRTVRPKHAKLIDRHIAQRRHLYAMAVSQGDTKAALSVLDSEARLLGIGGFARTGMENTFNLNGPVVLNLEHFVTEANKQLTAWRAHEDATFKLTGHGPLDASR